MALRPSRANMLLVNRSAAKASVSSPRRFILLPEELVDALDRPEHPRVRRYQLSGLGRGAGRGHAGISNAGLATARNARGGPRREAWSGRLGRM